MTEWVLTKTSWSWAQVSLSSDTSRWQIDGIVTQKSVCRNRVNYEKKSTFQLWRLCCATGECFEVHSKLLPNNPKLQLPMPIRIQLSILLTFCDVVIELNIGRLIAFKMPHRTIFSYPSFGRISGFFGLPVVVTKVLISNFLILSFTSLLQRSTFYCNTI